MDIGLVATNSASTKELPADVTDSKIIIDDFSTDKCGFSRGAEYNEAS